MVKPLADSINQNFGVPSPGAVNDKLISFFQNLHTGTGSPEGVVTADPGHFYFDLTNGVAYSKQAGSGNTGWSSGTARNGTYARRGRWVRSAVPHLDLSVPTVIGNPPTRATSGPGGSTPIAGSTTLAHDTTLVTRLGMVAATFSQFSVDYDQNTVDAAWTPAPYAVEFDTDADDLVFRFRNNANGTARLWLWVDGHPATAVPDDPGANSGGGSIFRWRITFPSVAWRRVRIYAYQADFGGLEVAPTHTVAPTQRPATSVLVYGDSYVEGTGADYKNTSWAAILGRLLGVEVFVAGQGGTGYVNSGGGGNKAAYTDSARLAKVAAAAPDFVIVFGSSNDDNLSGIQAAAASVYAALAAIPNCKVVVVGPPNTSSTPTAARLAVRNAVQAAAAAASNVIGFIDPIAEGWISGTGKQGATTGDGNADLLVWTDGIHPSQSGHEMYARRIAQEALALVEAAA